MSYLLSEEIFVRISRRDDYYPHKVVSLMVAVSVLVVVALLMIKKLIGQKLGWEVEKENYAPEWPNSIPARRIASAGSLCQSKCTSRRPSEPCIDEESEGDFSGCDCDGGGSTFELGGESLEWSDSNKKLALDH